MTENDKLVSAKKTIRGYIYLGIFYLALTLLAIIDLFFIRKDDSIVIFSNVAIVLYVISLLSLIFVILNYTRYKSPTKIRKKAIKDSDERRKKIRQKANSNTFALMILILYLGLIFSVPLNSIELFGYCLISLVLIIIINTINIFILNKRH